MRGEKRSRGSLRAAASDTTELRPRVDPKGPLRLLGSLVRRADTRRADEQLRAILERDVAAVGTERAVLRLEALHFDLGAVRQRVAVPATAQQRIRRTAFDHPLLNLAGRRRHVDVDPRMRVDPIHLRDRDRELDGTVRVELGRERVVSDRWRCERREQYAGGNTQEFHAHCSHLRASKTFYERTLLGFLHEVSVQELLGKLDTLELEQLNVVVEAAVQRHRDL